MTASEIYQVATEFHGRHELEQAIAAYRQALSIDPQFLPAWYSQGCAWATQSNHAAAAACFGEALSIMPDHREAQHNLGKALFGLGLVDEALVCFRRAVSLGGGFLPRTAMAVVIPGSPTADNDSILATRRSWAETHLPPPPPYDASDEGPRNGRKLRVGYISSFFAQDKWMKPVWGLINHHDRQQVEVHLFSDTPESNGLAGYCRQAEDRFHDISGMSNHEAARQIKASKVHILVDLNGYSQMERLAVIALKPAPIVVGWFNAFSTSGMSCYDYLIGDAEVIRPEEEHSYCERILRVPGSYLTFEVLHPVPDVTEPPILHNASMTFGCLASAYKITPPVVEAWSCILQQAPGTRLFVKNASLGWAENRRFLAQRFAQNGVDPDRITMEGPAEHLDFLSAYRHVDIALDPFPYNGGTTTMEALWQGVPVLTFSGDRWAARQSASILRAAGLTEYVAADADEYVQLALSLARGADTRARLRELRQGMRAHLSHSSVCDTARFARNMEALYAEMLARAPG